MRSSIVAGVALSVALSAPAEANLFGIGHVEPTPPPHGGWNFTSKTFSPYSKPALTGLVVQARCRYVAPHEPYQWQFVFANQTGSPMAFDMGLIQYNNMRLATVAQKWSTIEQSSIQHVAVGPKRAATIIEAGRYGCPGMEGGTTNSRHYIVAVDNVRVGSQVVRSGVFADYDTEVMDARTAWNEGTSAAAAAGIHDGLQSQVDLLNSMSGEYEVPY